MKSKILNFALIVSSLFGYLEWGGGNSSFLFQAEAGILSKLFTDPQSAMHPFVLLPLAGQLVLVVTLFQKQPGKFLTFVGMIGIGILIIFMFIIGLMSLNFKIVLSTIPFLVIGGLTIRHHSSAFRKNGA